MCIGEIISFGKYFQKNGEEKTDIEWIVIGKKGQDTLLLSKNALDVYCFDSDSDSGTTWEKSKIRNWLNNTFFNEAFDQYEKAKIKKARISTKENISKQEYINNFKKRMAERYTREGSEVDKWHIEDRVRRLRDVDQGEDTFDKVFLLSTNEVDLYLDSEEKIRCNPTEFAQNKCDLLNIRTFGRRNSCSWWLRSMATEDFLVCYVDDSIEPDGHNCTGEDFVRPAIWVDFNIDSLVIIDDCSEDSDMNFDGCQKNGNF